MSLGRRRPIAFALLLTLPWLFGDSGIALAQPAALGLHVEGPDDAQTSAQRAAASTIETTVGGEVVGRHFQYRNGIKPGGSLFTLFPSPAATIGGQMFPLAHAGAPWGDVGVIAEYLRIFSAMNDASNVAADVRPSAYSGGLRVRIHPGPDPRLILGLSVEYAVTSFRSVGSPPFDLPDVTYRSVRTALDSRVYFGRFSLIEEVAFRAIVDEATISTRFYAPEGYGLDAEVGAAFVLFRGIEARLVVDYENYAFSFTPPPGATFGSGSARDQLYGARLALAFGL